MTMGRKGDAKRQQIVDTSKKMLLENGLEGLVLRDVAEKLDMTHGNLQYYFPTRHDLFVAIFDQEIAKYTDGMKEAVAATSSRRGRLSAIIDSGLTILRSPDTALWRIVMSMADHRPEMAAILKKENDLYEATVTRELKHIAPRMSLQRRRHIAKIIHAILDGIGIQYVHENPDSADMRALESEIKAAIIALVEAD
jgi:AcrR family transcriptional regulator